MEGQRRENRKYERLKGGRGEGERREEGGAEEDVGAEEEEGKGD